MTGLFDKQAEEYLDARPTYPAEWDSMLADRTSLINRVLKQHGVFAMWGYNDFDITPDIDAALKRFHDTTFPYWKEDINYLMVIHKELSFESVGLGSEGSPLKLDIPKKLAFDSVLGMLRS
ncbi:hypothetical protein Tco_0036175 [Tanacetum coccineum]